MPTTLRLSACILATILLATPSLVFAKGPRVGETAPELSLQGVDGKTDLLGGDVDVYVVVFICSKCPVAAAYTPRLNELVKRYKGKNVRVVAVNASDDLSDSRRHAKRFRFGYAHDASGRIAKTLGARMTPEAIVLDSSRRIMYRGAIDNSQRRPTKHYVRDAIDGTLAKRPIKIAETDPFGCSLRLLAIKTAGSGE